MKTVRNIQKGDCMNIICLFCKNDVSFLKSILMFTYEYTDSKKEVRICSECIMLMNILMAGKYREQGVANYKRCFGKKESA